MLRFDETNKLIALSKTSHYWSGSSFSALSRKPLLQWKDDSFASSLSLKNNHESYKDFGLKLFTTSLILDLQLFRDELFKNCLVIGKFSFVQLETGENWLKNSVVKVDVTYNNGEINAIRSHISPEDYRQEYLSIYRF